LTSFRDERELPAVRRPPGRGVLLSRGQLAWLVFTLGANDPYRRSVFVRVPVGRGEDVGDLAAVRGELRIGGERDRVEVLELERTRHRFDHRPAAQRPLCLPRRKSGQIIWPL